MKAENICCLFLVCSINCSSLVYSQAPGIQWDKNYGGSNYEDFNLVRQTSDGGYISAGWSQSPVSGVKTQANWDPSNNTPDYWIVKSDASGTIQWDKTFGGTNWETCGSLQQTSDGGYILGGYSSSPASGDKTQPSKGLIDYWIVKLDVSGNKQWDKTFGGTSNDYLTRIIQTDDGGYLLGGFSQSNSGADKSQPSRGAEDYWIIKTDASGNKLWDKTFGGNLNDFLYSIQQTSDGGYILGGTSASTLSGDRSENNRGPLSTFDYWIVRTDGSGNKIWDKRFGTSDDDLCTVAIQTPDGGFITGGYSSGLMNGDRSVDSRGSYDYWIVKTNSTGIKQWDKRYGGTDIDYLFSMQVTTDGGFIMGGTSYSNTGGDKTQNSRGSEDYWIIKTDGSGMMQWDKTMGGSSSDWLNYVSQTSDGYYVCGGQSYSPISGEKSQALTGISDYWVVKLGPVILLPIELLTFDGQNQNGKNILTWETATELNSAFFEIEKSNDSKNFTSVGRVQAAGNSSSYLSYSFTDPEPFNRINYYRLMEVDYDGQKNYSKTIAILSPSLTGGNIQIYPNPAEDFFIIKTNHPFDLSVSDLDGRIFFNHKHLASGARLSCATFPGGCYILEIKIDGKIIRDRLIVVRP